MVWIASVALLSAPALAKPGDLIVGDSDARTVLRINPASGADAVIADDFGSAGPDGIAFDKRGNIYTAAYAGGVNDAIFRIAPGGSVSTLASGPPLESPSYLDFNPDGKIYVADEPASIFKLAPGGGQPVPFVSEVAAPFGIETAHDASLFASGTDGVFRVNRRTGAATDIAPGLFVPGGMTLTPDGTLFMISDDHHSVYRINPRARTFEPLVDASPALQSAYDITIHPNGFLYLTNNLGGIGTIQRLDPATGEMTEIASESDPESDMIFPEGIEVQPPRCASQVATIVGSNEPDRLKGSKFRRRRRGARWQRPHPRPGRQRPDLRRQGPRPFGRGPRT